MFGLFSGSSAQVSAQDVERQLNDPAGPLLVDVREVGEYQQGHIPGAKLIPLGTLASRLHELPRDKRIVAVCRSGARSGSATAVMRKAGLDAVNMAGGMLAWRGPVER